MTAKRTFDVVIGGGGPAGAAAALVLARRGRRVLLADASPETLFRVGEGLPPAALPLLRDLGVLPRFLSGGHLPSYGNVSAWGSGEARMTDFIFNPNGHGFHLDRARFDALLREAATEAGADVVAAARVEARAGTGAGTGPGAGTEIGEVNVRVGGKEEVVGCRWVVDATGRPSTIARAKGAVRRAEDALIAFYGRFRAAPRSTPDSDSRTLLESVPGGWWYAALVPSKERVIAFLTDEDLANREALLSPEGLTARLSETKHIGALVEAHGYAIHGRPRGADAASARLDTFAGADWIATGDAAMSFDPLSSQGILNALYTGLQAGHALNAALDGDAGSIERYAARLDEIYRAYRHNRVTYYAYETRWPDRPFWQRRAAHLATADGYPN